MSVIARTRIDKYYRITVLSDIRKLLELKKNGEVEWVFENG
ncbi:MAG: hypothetical protein QXS31_06065 [Desulfurococcaceae archaeon]